MQVPYPEDPEYGLSDVFEDLMDSVESPFIIEAREDAWGTVESEHQLKSESYPDTLEVSPGEPI